MSPWPGSDSSKPEFATWLLYLDCGEDFARLEPLLRRWYDETCRLLLPFVHPMGASAPAASLTAFEQDAAGRGRRRKPQRWADGLSEGLFQYSAHWFDVAPSAIASELDLYFFRFAAQRHIKLQISIGFADRPDRLSLVLPALVELARLMGDSTDPTYGEIVVNAGSLAPATMLDTALGLSAEVSAEASRRYLRGYEWVTICPKELTGRLGGPDRLRASGAFAEVLPLAYGGLMLRATERPDDYRADRVRATFRALAPALPPGRPGVASIPAELPGDVSGLPGPDLSRVVFADSRQPDVALELGPGLPTKAESRVVPALAPAEGFEGGFVPGRLEGFPAGLDSGFPAGFTRGPGSFPNGSGPDAPVGFEQRHGSHG